MSRLDLPYIFSVLLAATALYFAWTRALVVNELLILVLVATLQPAIYYLLRLATRRYS